MRKKIWYSAIGLLVVGILLAGLLGVIDTLAGVRPSTVSKPSIPSIGKGNSTALDKVDLSKDISLYPSTLPHTPLFDIIGSTASSFLRSTATLNYDGKLWNFQSSSPVQPYNGGRINPPVVGYSKKITSDVTINSLQDFGQGADILPTMLYPVSVDSPVPLSYLPDDQLFLSSQGLPESYSFESVQFKFDNATLQNASVAQDPQYLQLPPETTDRTRQLAQEITRDIDSPYQKAQAIESYLKNNYQYDFAAQPAPDGQEPNDWFLFEEKKGVCTNFNSAFVALARSVGLPSRLVGGYAIKPDVKEQTVYADQAHAWSEVKFKDIGWQAFDATGRSPDPLPTFTEIKSVGNTVKKGVPFNVQGTVTSPGVVVEGVMVELFINPQKSRVGGLEVGKGLVTAGQFNIVASIPVDKNVGNYQLLAHAQSNIRFAESWSDPRLKVTTDTRLSLDVPSRIRFNDLLQVKGNLSEVTDIPVGGQEIKILINKALAGRVTSDKTGQFTWDQTFKSPGRYNFDFVFTDTEFYIGTAKQSTVDVLVPVAITLQSPAKAVQKETVTLTGTLKEESSGSPISSQKILVKVNKQPIEKEVITDSRGNFTFQQAFDNTGIHQLEVVSDFTKKYWESRHTSAVEVVPLVKQFPWLYLGLAVLVLAGAVAYYLLYYRKKSAVLQTAVGDSQKIEPSASPTMLTDNTPVAVLKIEFTSIVSPFPDVWGVNEEIEIVYRLLDPSGRILTGANLKIHIAGLNASLTTGEQGTASLLTIFSQKGEYIIEAGYSGRDALRGVTSTRTLKIVDYREEIIALFKSIKTWFNDQGLSFPLEATPREIKEIVEASDLKIPSEVLSRLVSDFEEADYSLHPVNREHYLKMFLILKEIKTYAR